MSRSKKEHVLKESDSPGFYEIPGFSRYLVSAKGFIVDAVTLSPIETYERPTSKGSYLNVSMQMDISTAVIQISVHRVVCFVFHGPPVNANDDVNHDDGNKHNNAPDNIHWCTRSENLIHSYKSGLRSDNRKIRLTDIIDNTVTDFYSMGQLAKFLNVSKNKVWVIIRDSGIETPYQDRYVIEKVDWENVKPRQSTWTKTILAKNYSTNTLFVCGSLAEVEQATGILRATVYFNLNKSTGCNLVEGWYFKYREDTSDWPEFDERDVRLSLLQISSGIGYPISVTNTETGVTTDYGSLTAFAKMRCVHPTIIRRKIAKSNGVYEHYVIKRL